MWQYVEKHFSDFQNNISPQQADYDDALTKAKGIAKSLHTAYWPGAYDPANTYFTGSYGKNTAIKNRSDVDLLCFLPINEFYRFNSYQGNGQSAFLQEVKQKLQNNYSTTEMKSDGQVVIVKYNSKVFEVVPAFNLNGQIIIADTNNGGKWKFTDPTIEINQLNEIDTRTWGAARALIQYLKEWKYNKSVPLKSIILEIGVYYFLKDWYWRESLVPQLGKYYYDWMVRDFFAFLLQYNRARIQGTEEIVFFELGWEQKTRDALNQAIKACDFEKSDHSELAKEHWLNIFGNRFSPVTPLVTRQALFSSLTNSTLLGTSSYE